MSGRIFSGFALGGILAAAVSLAGCRGGKPEAKAPPDPVVTVAVPVSHPVIGYTYFNGYLDAIDAVEVRARVKGILRAKHFTEGTEVKKGTGATWFATDKGTLLYEIDDREYKTAQRKAKADVKKAQADITNWKTQIVRDEADLERVTQLLAKGIGVPADKDKAVAQVEVDKAQLEAANAEKEAAEASVHSAEIQLGYTKIYAEIDGRVNRTLVPVGNLVGQTEPTLLTTIVRMDALHVYFDAPERDLVTYQKLLRGKGETELPSGGIPVEVGVATEDGYPHKGTIEFRENRVETGSGTIRIRGTLDNADRVLYPGLYARVRIPTGAPEPRLLIPEAALLTGQEGRFVYVINAENKADKRTVTPGVRVGTFIAIEKGLTAGDRVVVNGLQRVRPGATVVPELTTLSLTEPAKK